MDGRRVREMVKRRGTRPGIDDLHPRRLRHAMRKRRHWEADLFERTRREARKT